MINYEILTPVELDKNKTCIYELWDRENQSMTKCGEKAYGKAGLSLQKCLCEDYYLFSKTMIR